MYISMWHETLYYCHHVPTDNFYIYFPILSFHYIAAAMKWKITNDDIGKSLDMTTSANSTNKINKYMEIEFGVCV